MVVVLSLPAVVRLISSFLIAVAKMFRLLDGPLHLAWAASFSLAVISSRVPFTSVGGGQRGAGWIADVRALCIKKKRLKWPARAVYLWPKHSEEF